MIGRGRSTPEEIHTAMQCPLRCCRAPELASGGPIKGLMRRMYPDKIWFDDEISEVYQLVHSVYHPGYIVINCLYCQLFKLFNVQVWHPKVWENIAPTGFIWFFWNLKRVSKVEVGITISLCSVHGGTYHIPAWIRPFYGAKPIYGLVPCTGAYVHWIMRKVSTLATVALETVGVGASSSRRSPKDCEAMLVSVAAGGLGTRHRQSRRFLDPGYNNGPNDPALYPLVKMVAEGAPIQSPLMDPMISWLGRFRLLRVAERRVEGIHSQVTHCIKRARRASTAYISIELRFKDFWNFIARNPGVASHT